MSVYLLRHIQEVSNLILEEKWETKEWIIESFFKKRRKCFKLEFAVKGNFLSKGCLSYCGLGISTARKASPWNNYQIKFSNYVVMNYLITLNMMVMHAIYAPFTALCTCLLLDEMNFNKIPPTNYSWVPTIFSYKALFKGQQSKTLRKRILLVSQVSWETGQPLEYCFQQEEQS